MLRTFTLVKVSLTLNNPYNNLISDGEEKLIWKVMAANDQ